MTAKVPDPVPSESWHMDKKVPIAIIVTIIIQTLSLGWWASKLDSRVANLEENDKRHDDRLKEDRAAIEAGSNNLNAINMRLVRVEEQTSTTRDLVKEINGKLDTFLRRQP